MHRYCRFFRYALFLFLLFRPLLPCWAGLIYVDASASGANTGVDWPNAYTDLQDALGTASDGDEIWVAEGTYLPQPSDDRSATFQLVAGVSVYGGFTPSMTSRAERDWEAHETILSGDIGVPGDDTDNAYHVVTGVTGATLDGFTITKGYANYAHSSTHRKGGGIFCNGTAPTIRHCLFTGNYAQAAGGSGWNGGAGATGVYERCTIRESNAGTYVSALGFFNENAAAPVFIECSFRCGTVFRGGGINNNGASPHIVRCVFGECEDDNQNGAGGTAIYSSGASDVRVEDSVFVASRAHKQLGAIRLDTDARMTLIGCLFAGNSGKGIYLQDNASLAMRDCVFAGNWSSSGAAVMLNSVNAVIAATNCLFVGNRNSFSTWSRGGALQMRSTNSILENCTITGNMCGDKGGGLHFTGGKLTLKNTIVYGNVNRLGDAQEIWNEWDGTNFIAFTDVQGGWDGAYVQNESGAETVNLGGNLDVNPLFTPAVKNGAFSANAEYSSETFQSVAYDSSANWEPNALKGWFLYPNPDNDYFQYPIVSNDNDSIVIWGDVSDVALQNVAYEVHDYHLQSKAGRYTASGWVTDNSMSPCIDIGDPDSPYENEPYYHGERINIGAYGNTAQASKTMPPGSLFRFY